MAFRRFLPRLIYVSFGRYTCLLIVFLLASCSSANTIVSQATPTLTAGPPHVKTPLAPPPQDCAISYPPKQRLTTLGSKSNVPLKGDGPFWIYDGYYQDVLHLAPFGHWPETKMIVEVGPNYNQPITLRLRKIGTDVLAWWTDGRTPPGTSVQTLVLNPQTNTQDVGTVSEEPDIPHGSPEPGWKEWGIFPLFPEAGCYTLEVSWANGSWQSRIAVGN